MAAKKTATLSAPSMTAGNGEYADAVGLLVLLPLRGRDWEGYSEGAPTVAAARIIHFAL
jgi:hypothetical protein